MDQFENYQLLHPPPLLPLYDWLKSSCSHCRPHVPWGTRCQVFRLLWDLFNLAEYVWHLDIRWSLKIRKSYFLLTFWFFSFKDSMESSSSSSLIVADWTLKFYSFMQKWSKTLGQFERFVDLAVVAPVEVCDTFDEDPERFRWCPGPRLIECLQDRVLSGMSFSSKHINVNNFQTPSRDWVVPSIFLRGKNFSLKPFDGIQHVHRHYVPLLCSILNQFFIPYLHQTHWLALHQCWSFDIQKFWPN